MGKQTADEFLSLMSKLVNKFKENPVIRITLKRSMPVPNTDGDFKNKNYKKKKLAIREELEAHKQRTAPDERSFPLAAKIKTCKKKGSVSVSKR
jgi:hypothetical protein